MRSFPRPHGADQKNQASLLLGGTRPSYSRLGRPLGSPSRQQPTRGFARRAKHRHVAAEFKCKSFRVVNALTPAMIA